MYQQIEYAIHVSNLFRFVIDSESALTKIVSHQVCQIDETLSSQEYEVVMYTRPTDLNHSVFKSYLKKQMLFFQQKNA